MHTVTKVPVLAYLRTTLTRYGREGSPRSSSHTSLHLNKKKVTSRSVSSPKGSKKANGLVGTRGRGFCGHGDPRANMLDPSGPAWFRSAHRPQQPDLHFRHNFCCHRYQSDHHPKHFTLGRSPFFYKYTCIHIKAPEMCERICLYASPLRCQRRISLFTSQSYSRFPRSTLSGQPARGLARFNKMQASGPFHCSLPKTSWMTCTRLKRRLHVTQLNRKNLRLRFRLTVHSGLAVQLAPMIALQAHKRYGKFSFRPTLNKAVDNSSADVSTVSLLKKAEIHLGHFNQHSTALNLMTVCSTKLANLG